MCGICVAIVTSKNSKNDVILNMSGYKNFGFLDNQTNTSLGWLKYTYLVTVQIPREYIPSFYKQVQIVSDAARTAVGLQLGFL